MVSKPSDITLSEYGIDSYERAIIFCGLILEAQTKANQVNDDKVIVQFNIAPNPDPTRSMVPQSVLFFDITLPFAHEASLKSMGEYPKNTTFLSLGNGLPLLSDEEVPPWYWTNPNYALPSTPVWCDTIEEWLYFLCTEYQAKLIQSNSQNWELISITIDHDNQETKLEINIPINYVVWLLTHNYLIAAMAISSWPDGVSANLLWSGAGNGNPPLIPPYFDNTSIINNDFLLVN